MSGDGGASYVFIKATNISRFAGAVISSLDVPWSLALIVKANSFVPYLVGVLLIALSL